MMKRNPLLVRKSTIGIVLSAHKKCGEDIKEPLRDIMRRGILVQGYVVEI
jgi:hypothetical protein